MRIEIGTYCCNAKSSRQRDIRAHCKTLPQQCFCTAPRKYCRATRACHQCNLIYYAARFEPPTHSEGITRFNSIGVGEPLWRNW